MNMNDFMKHIAVFCVMLFLSNSINFSFAIPEENPQHLDEYYRYRDSAIRYKNINWDTSNLYIDSCLFISKELNNSFFLGKAYHLKSQNLLLKSEVDSAFKYMEASAAVMRHYPDSLDHFIMEYNLGNMYLYNDDDIKALVQYKKVLTIINQNFDVYAKIDLNKVNLNRAYTHVSVGMVYGKLGDNLRALENLRKGLRIAFRIKTKESEILRAITLGNIGLTYYKLGDFINAEIYTVSGLDQKIKLNLRSLYGYNYQILGEIAFGKKKYDLALRYIELSDKHFNDFNNSTEIDRNNFIRAKCLQKQGKYQEAIAILKVLIPIYESSYVKSELVDIYQLYSECLRATGDMKNAYAQYKISNIIQKRLNRENKSRMINQYLEFFKEEELEIKRKLVDLINQKEKEQLEIEYYQEKNNKFWGFLAFGLVITVVLAVILVLWNINRRNKSINLRLLNSIEDKQMLFKEVHHRVKNNFQVISSLLSLQQGSSQNVEEQRALENAQVRVQSMALVHELLYRKNEVKTLDFKEYLEELVKTLFESYTKEGDGISYVVNCEKTYLDLDVAIPLGLLVNEIVTNSLKYAFTETNLGQINITLSKIDENKYSLIIKDNGKGIPQDFIDGSSETLGVELIKILSEQLRGSAKFIVERGTTIEILFETEQKKLISTSKN